jgi:ABC-2 type transport system ATP-binding protein
MAMTELVVETVGLTRLYGRTPAVDSLDLRVGRGEMYGFLGPNGAGKTTTLALVLGIEQPTRGSVRLFGVPLRGRSPALLRRIGVVPEHPHLYEDMTAQAYLGFFARLYGVGDAGARIAFLLDALDLAGRARDRLGEFSRGMAQKIGLARALLQRAELLILDEPVANLDPQGIKQVRDLVAAENQRGATVIVSSHLLSEVERTCHRVGILHAGRLVAQGTLSELRARLAGATRLRVEVDRPALVVERLRALPDVREVTADGRTLAIVVDGGEEDRARLSREIVDAGATILSMEVREASLEETFLAATTPNQTAVSGVGTEKQGPGRWA